MQALEISKPFFVLRIRYSVKVFHVEVTMEIWHQPHSQITHWRMKMQLRKPIFFGQSWRKSLYFRNLFPNLSSLIETKLVKTKVLIRCSWNRMTHYFLLNFFFSNTMMPFLMDYLENIVQGFRPRFILPDVLKIQHHPVNQDWLIKIIIGVIVILLFK